MTGKKFIFKDVSWNEERTTASFKYEIVTDEKSFELLETLEFPLEIPETHESQSLARALHIALGISYYKAFVPPTIEHPYEMSDLESTFWNTVYIHGLGEFLYKNKLSSSILAKFTEQSGYKIEFEVGSQLEEAALLGIGGGKDSIVAGELLKDIELPITGFVLATGEILGQTKSVSSVMNIDLLPVKRRLDKQIIEINSIDGSYNGHIPISLVFALTGCMLGVATNKKYIVVANEASASLPQAKWEESDVNHQWSKSLQFERLFQDYLRAYISSDLRYFSAIRPLTSVAIAKVFTNYPNYFEVFTSDNSLFKIEQSKRDHPRWSRNSSKSLSSFILLAPWMSESDMLRTFGHNYLEDESLSDMLLDLLGASENSILDCVGTPDELRYCLNEIHRQSKFKNSVLINLASEKNLLGSNDKYFEIGEHSIPNELTEKLISKMEQKL